ncbi:MAG TPA: DegV family protein [Clostridia bacterium]|nr:DegV family protein [Clostridia bacterium]
MAKIEVFADSSCDFPREYAAAMHISIVPLTVSFGNRQFTDGVDIDTNTFFRLLRENPSVIPKTSAPSPDEFMKAFLGVGDDCEKIICVTVTSKSSSSYNSAVIAKNILNEDPGFKPQIIVFDSLNASLAIGFIASEATALAQQGEAFDKILLRLNQMRNRTSIYFILDTLEYVRKGGRIGAIKAVLGSLLNIKPILTFRNGTPADVDKTRGFPQAQLKLVKLFTDKAISRDEVYIIHAASKKHAEELADTIQRLAPNICIHIFEVGAVMGTYTGPGGIGLVFEEKFNKQ